MRVRVCVRVCVCVCVCVRVRVRVCACVHVHARTRDTPSLLSRAGFLGQLVAEAMATLGLQAAAASVVVSTHRCIQPS